MNMGKPKKVAYEPPMEAKQAYGSFVAAMETMAPGDKAYFIKKLKNLYFTDLKQASPPVKREKTEREIRAGKNAWKAEWHETEQYKKWISLRKQNPTEKERIEYQSAQEDAFRIRNQLKERAMRDDESKEEPATEIHEAADPTA